MQVYLVSHSGAHNGNGTAETSANLKIEIVHDGITRLLERTVTDTGFNDWDKFVRSLVDFEAGNTYRIVTTQENSHCDAIDTNIVGELRSTG